MEFSKQILKKASDLGAKEASDAFSKLSGEKVTVTSSVAELISYDMISSNLNKTGSKALVIYTQLIEGVEGVSILIISRSQAMNLIDLLNKREIGSTGFMMDFEKSAVKESLNILSNSYLNALSKLVDTQMMTTAPYIVRSESLANIIKKVRVTDAEKVLMFQTVLGIKDYNIEAKLYMIFNKDFFEILKENK